MSWYPSSAGARVVLSPVSSGEEDPLSPLPDTRPILEDGRRQAGQGFAGDRVGELLRLPQPAQTRIAGLDDPGWS